MRFRCPSCRTPYNVPDERLLKAGTPNGVRTRCKACGVRMLIDMKNGRVQEDPSSFKSTKTPPSLSQRKLREEFPTVLSMSKGAKKGIDFTAAVFLVLILSMAIGAGCYAFKTLDMQAFKEWIQSLAEFKDNFSLPRIVGEFAGKKPLPSIRQETVSARSLIRKGYELYQKERLDPALEAFNQAIDVDPKNPEAYYWKGRTLVRKDQDTPAMDAFKQALILRHDYWEALDNIGWLHIKRGEYPPALSYLNRSIELKPDNAWAFFNRSFLHEKTGNLEMALEDAEKACQLGYQKGCQIAQKYRDTLKTGESSGN